MRKKIQTMRERKATLIAEVRYIYYSYLWRNNILIINVLDACFVLKCLFMSLFIRFLRRRYRHLRQDQPVMHPPDVKKGRGRSKSKTQVSSPNKRSEAETKHVTLPDLNHSVNETKTSLEKRVPLFDLNQISVSTSFTLYIQREPTCVCVLIWDHLLNWLQGEEEEEREATNNERTRVQESSSCTRKSSTEMPQQQKEMKLSSCRNGGNGSNKRKVSWQDPVAAAALRV